ncbi:hypothetical protein ACIRNI_23210 [Streptomyces sp. NPDC093546]|uniref:hypothetical protein n=1 Tax=Streptomyces sp. NPDC093546 TaxID=3366040 RepID=UPI0038019A93
MFAFRRTVVAAVLASVGIVSLAAPGAQADPANTPAVAAARAAAAVPVDTPVHLIENASNRGVTIEVYANWDYALLTNDSGSKGTKVIFRQQGDGYTIESTSGHWGGYTYWSGVGNGVRLDTRENATVFQVVPSSRGFLIADKHKNYATYPSGGKGWLQLFNTVLPNFREFAYFRVEQ